MKRVIYNVNLTNGTTALNRAAQQYCRLFKGLEFPTSGDFFAFVRELESYVDTLNKKHHRCTQLKVVGSISGKSLNVNMKDRVDANVVRMLLCQVVATYTKVDKYQSVITLNEEGDTL